MAPSSDSTLFTKQHSRRRSVSPSTARNAAQAHRLGGPDPNEPDGAGRRKLECMAAVHRREGKDEAKVTDRTKEARSARELHHVQPDERLDQAEGIANMLSQAITTRHLLYANLGTAEYMEFVLKNPFNAPQTVTVLSDDPELSAITNTEEWAYFKALCRTTTPLEENMFHLEEGAPGPRLYLRPKERVHIPLKYQSFLCDHTMALQVTFMAEDGKPMAICQVDVEPTPHVVDQTFRLYHPELCFLKKAIRLPPWNDPTGAGGASGRVLESAGESQSKHKNVLCDGQKDDQCIYTCPPAIETEPEALIGWLSDAWLAAPSQIWQMYVHFLERVDVSCVSGQRSGQSLVLRGKQAARKVKCFSSHPQEVEVRASTRATQHSRPAGSKVSESERV
ncbi:Nephrocystin-4 [Liparis tanakae]|uniref:Nephrocystin-4 n=1 Tax=Liparis tanakae TaxID=230148 RepID=A0A4Z2GH78_9TELE|nr:Nephrocystin-4 [Liparis tanakae]